MRPLPAIALAVAGCSSPGNGVTCGDGTTLDGTTCVPEPGVDAGPAGHYLIQAWSMFGADGKTPNAVRVLGTKPDGTPATDLVVVNNDRFSAGHYTSPQLQLGSIGAETAFIPCDMATPGCLGPATLTLALANAPDTIVARHDVMLVDPILVNPANECLGGGNVLYLRGDDQIFTGEETITNATWTPSLLFPELVTLDVVAATESWNLQFNTARVQNISMFPGTYLDAVIAYNVTVGTQPVGHPAMNISGNGHACDSITGQFQILAYDAGSSPNMTIVFDQHCNASTTTVLHGCLHFQQ